MSQKKDRWDGGGDELVTCKAGSGIREEGLVGGPFASREVWCWEPFRAQPPRSVVPRVPTGTCFCPPGPPAPGAPQPLLAWLLLPVLLCLLLAAYVFR